MTNLLLEVELDGVEAELEMDLGRGVVTEGISTDGYIEQFDEALRAEADRMASHYEVFYCLEKTIRGLIEDVMEAAEGENWWDSARIPPHTRQEVEKRIKRERESGVTPRSQRSIEYSTFGELSEIIKANWPLFGGVLNDPKAVERVMSGLNALRGPIAHCSPLAEDEVLRLDLTLRDWFRQFK